MVNVEHKKYFRASLSPSLSTLNAFWLGLDVDDKDDDDDEDEPSWLSLLRTDAKELVFALLTLKPLNESYIRSVVFLAPAIRKSASDNWHM